MKLALGTVQFGLNYGISNQQGQVDKAQVAAILAMANELGIETLDCAGAYGNSEKVLGELSADKHFSIVSKVPELSEITANKDQAVARYFKKSLADLQANQLDSLLFHQVDDLLIHPNKNDFFQQAVKLKEQNLVRNIGVSLYHPAQLTAIIQNYNIDIAQVPVNIFDQRFLKDELIELCHSKRVKLHARSLLLQGLIFIETEQLPAYFLAFKEKLLNFKTLAKKLACSPLTLALSVLNSPLTSSKDSKVALRDQVIEKLVLGVCSTKQLEEVVNCYHEAQKLNITQQELAMLADERIEFINPALWATE